MGFIPWKKTSPCNHLFPQEGVGLLEPLLPVTVYGEEQGLRNPSVIPCWNLTGQLRTGFKWSSQLLSVKEAIAVLCPETTAPQWDQGCNR